MRLLLALCLTLFSSQLIAASVPTELAEALKTFRADGPKGWAFTQTTVAGDRTRIERFDPLGRHSVQWKLVQEDGRTPSSEEVAKYTEVKARRSTNETAPNVKDQIIPESCEIVSETPERAAYRFRLKPGAEDDHAAEHMRATFTLHRPTGAIESVELASIGPFSPVLMVKIGEARTVMTYSPPSADRPSLLQTVTVRIRGKAMWFRSLDQDMTVTYSDYTYSGKN